MSSNSCRSLPGTTFGSLLADIISCVSSERLSLLHIVQQLWYSLDGTAQRLKQNVSAARHVGLRQQFVIARPAVDIDIAEEEALQKVTTTGRQQYSYSQWRTPKGSRGSRCSPKFFGSPGPLRYVLYRCVYLDIDYRIIIWPELLLSNDTKILSHTVLLIIIVNFHLWIIRQ